jgi:hypothetical protein
MKPLRALAIACTLLSGTEGASRSAQAQEERPRQLGVALGYAFPAGSAERGTNLSDVTFGIIEVGIDGAYRIYDRWSIGLAAHYGVAIPTICSSSSECKASLGHDVRVGALGRVVVGRWGSFAPDAEVELGYEWFASKLVDSDVTSERRYRGAQATLRAHGGFELTRAVFLGPSLELGTGIFGHTSLHAPGIQEARSTEGTHVHLWLGAGIRASTAW